MKSRTAADSRKVQQNAKSLKVEQAAEKDKFMKKQKLKLKKHKRYCERRQSLQVEKSKTIETVKLP